ncbi:hypothetical protein HZ994_15860 [Akkermansiaceae bacterium]|nr:hypothetical protein HZ994_15860 [Akkermansiaceae bacterium]
MKSISFPACTVALLLSLSLEAKPQRPEPDLLHIDNQVVKVGIDRSMGAAITWLSWVGHPENTINIHDPGRLLQQSYYAGRSLDRQADGQSKSWSPWTWNPIQGGGVNSWARVTEFRKTVEGRLHSETVPKLWDMPDEEAEALMEQSTEFLEDMPNVVLVSNRLICKRMENDRWGDAVPRHQELPACYFTSRFRNVEMYLGDGKWEKVSQPPGPPWGKAQPPLNIMACFTDAGQGIAVFSPTADQHWNFGPHGAYNPNAKPTDSPCMHLAPIGKLKIAPKSVLGYRYWMVMGSKEEIEPRLDVLLKEHRDEKLKVTEPG